MTQPPDHDVPTLVDEWITGPNSEASGTFSYQARQHFPPAVLDWVFRYCAADPDLYLQPTAAALQNWAISYPRAKAARSRDAAAGAVRSFYRWLESDKHLVEPGTYRGLRFGSARFHRDDASGPKLGADAARWLMQAADRFRGSQPERARAVVYLLLDDKRPGQITGMLMQGRHEEGFRTTWDMPVKNASKSATARQEIRRDAVLALDEYLPHRKLRPSGGVTEERGPVFTTTNGNPLDEGKGVLRILRSVAVTHPELREMADELRADDVAHCPNPFITEPGEEGGSEG